jgi:response regulator RpfG family c-di-GMP phosphodiesterase
LLNIPNPLKVALKALKNFARLLVTGVLLAVIGVDSSFIARLVTDLTVKGLSLNQIREHIRLMYSLDVTKHELQKIRYKAAQKAKEVNHKTDREVAPKVRVLEVDEAFQGQENVILGAADKASAYVLAVKSAPDRTAASIAAFLRPIARSCVNVAVVITDLFRPYAEVVKVLFAKARHLLCHVHARRAVMRKMQKLEAKLARLQRQAAENSESLDRARAQVKATGAKQRALAKKIEETQGKIAGLRKQKRAARGGRTKTVDNRLASAQARLARYSAQNEEMEQKLAKLREKRDELRKLVRQDPPAVKKARQDVFQSGRLAKKFYDLLEDRSRSFEGHKTNLLKLLSRSKWTLAPYLAKFMGEHPHLFSLRKVRDLAPNRQNTNTIEGVFGLFRPLLNSTRRIQTPTGIDTYGELFRLYHNTTPPYTGFRNDTSPAERLGVNLHGKTYLDLLFPARGRVTRVVVGTLPSPPDDAVRAWALPGQACVVLAR